MKISNVPSTANTAPTQQGGLENMRSLTMRTNHTPGIYGQDPQSVVAQNAPDPDNDSKLNPATEDTQPISPQFARLAKERRALQVKERELKAREEAMATTSQGSDAIPLARLKAEPLKVLLESGVTYDELTQAILNGQGNSEVAELKTKLGALEQGIDDRFKKTATDQEQAVLAEMGREAKQLAATGEDFALTREMGRIPDVVSLIEKTYRESGEVLDVREAMELVEAELLKDAERIAGFEKVRQKYMPQMPPQQQRQTGMRTLTNRDTASVPMTAKQRALAAFNGTLKR